MAKTYKCRRLLKRKTQGKKKQKQRQKQKRKTFKKIRKGGTVLSFTTPKKTTQSEVKPLDSPFKKPLATENRYADLLIENLPKIIGDKSGSINGIILEIKPRPLQDIDRLIPNEKKTNVKENDSSVLKIPKKNSKKNISDNLMYEYEIGQYINDNFRKYYPCFVETRALYKIDNPNNYVKNLLLLDHKNEKIQREKYFSQFKIQQSGNITYSPENCDSKNKYKLEIEYLDGHTLGSMIENLPDLEIFNILFQIYAPLYILSDTKEKTVLFRHNDLHFHNIFVIELETPIQMTYTFNDPKLVQKQNNIFNFKYARHVNEYTIKTKYVAKIIDYGRGYIPETEEYVTQYKALSDDKKPSYIETLLRCGMKHVLYKYSDLKIGKAYKLIKEYGTFYDMLLTLMDEINTRKPEPEPESTSKPNFTLHIDCSTQPNMKKSKSPKPMCFTNGTENNQNSSPDPKLFGNTTLSCDAPSYF